jgi:hypothetical protein
MARMIRRVSRLLAETIGAGLNVKIANPGAVMRKALAVDVDMR